MLVQSQIGWPQTLIEKSDRVSTMLDVILHDWS
jgi:hypothetical protein